MRYIFILLLPILAFGASFIETEDCITLQGDTDYILIKKTDAYIPPISGIIVHDYSGNGNDGTNYGAVYADCKMTFNGVDDYVDTGLTPQDNWQYRLKARLITENGGLGLMVGYRIVNSRVYIGHSSSKWLMGYGTRSQTTTTAVNFVEHEFYLSNCYFFVDNILVSSQSYSFDSETRNVILGARDNLGDITEFANFEIMEYECYANNVLIQHFNFTK